MGKKLEGIINTAKKSGLVLAIFAAFAAQASIAACSGVYGCRPDPSDPYQEICKRSDCVEWGEREVECDREYDVDEDGNLTSTSSIGCITGYETETYCVKYEESTVTRTLSKPHTSKEKVCVSYDSSGDCTRYKTISVKHRN